MQIVSANKKMQQEGFMAAVKLEEADIEKFANMLKEKNEKEIWKEIVKFSEKEGHDMPFIDDEDGDKSILLEIKDNQWILFADIPGIKIGLSFILLNKSF